MEFTDILLLTLAGFGGGTIGAMLGVGGGMIIIPVLTGIFAFPFEQARATSLFAVIATSCGVAVATGKERFGNLRMGIILSIPTVTIALANAYLTHGLKSSLLFLLFAAVLIVGGIVMWRREKDEEEITESFYDEGSAGPLDGVYYDPKLKKEVLYRVRRVPVLLTISGIAGAISGLLGIGGGVFQVPAMSIFGGMPMRAAAATSNFLLGATAAASLPIYMARRQVRPIETGAVVLGVLGGAFFGSWLAKKIRGTTLKRLFTIALGFIAIQMLRKGLGW